MASSGCIVEGNHPEKNGRGELPFRRIEVDPGEKMRVDYGAHARRPYPTDALRKNDLFRLVMSYSCISARSSCSSPPTNTLKGRR